MALLTPKDMWAMYIDALSKGTQVGDIGSWMLTGNSLPAQLNIDGAGAPTFTTEQALRQIYQLGSVMPAWGTLESGAKEPLTMARFASTVGENVGLFYTPTVVGQFEQYASFVRSIQLEGNPDPVCLAQLRQKEEAFAEASAAWNQVYRDAREAFKEQDQYTDWNEFLKATPWGRQLDAADDKVRTTQNAVAQQNTECYGADALNLNRALDKIREVERGLTGYPNQFVMEVEDNSGKYPVPRYSPSELGASGYSGWLETAIANTGKLPPEVVISVRQGSQMYNYDEMTFSFGGSVSYFPFVWVDVDGSYEQIRVDSESAEFGIEIKIQSVTQVSISPGQWFEGSWLANYSKPEDHFEGSPFRDKNAWGPNGIYNTQTRSAVVAFRPEVIARFDSEAFKRVFEKWKAEATLKIGVGPFYLGVGGGASGTKEDMQWDEQQQSFSFTDKTLIPKILAVQVATPNWPPA